MSKMPGYEDYKDSFVAFIDILGFNRLVENIKDQESFYEVSKILATFKETAKRFNEDKKIFKDYNMLSASDSLIVTVPYSSDPLAYGLITFLHSFQYDLLATNFKKLIRGFINRGNVYCKDGIIFGSGFSKAFKMEKSIGGPPRIVISPEIVRDAWRKVKENDNESLDHNIFDYVSEDPSDGFHFIDYLKPIGTQTHLNPNEVKQERNSIKDFIDQSLIKYEKDIRIYPKYKWLSGYFTHSVSRGITG